VEAPRIIITQGERENRYLWLKYVTGIDLTRHCARALHGRYSRHVQPEHRHMDVALDEFPHAPILAYYLCAVTTNPYRWEDNAHLALQAAPGHSEELHIQGLTVSISGALPIPFDDSRIPDDDPHAHDRLYRTCRNWQFAHWLRHAGVNSIRGENRRGIGSNSPVTGQIPLL
jgi:hypothetical protein